MIHQPDGILLVDKPRDVTSFAVVDRIRKAFLRDMPRPAARSCGSGGRPPRFRCGHAGTLDPLATGLLLVLVGRGSRLAPFLLGLDKSYAATVRFGAETDTLDAEGEVVAEAAPPADVNVVAACLARFLGRIQQVPPVYSALKRDGQTLHRLARSGHEVAAPEPRTVTITKLEITASRFHKENCEVDFVIDCGSGTYIRSWARDLGRAAGSVAHLRALRRTRIGPFDIGDSVPGAMNLDSAALGGQLRPLALALPHLPSLVLTAAEARGVLDGGQPLPAWLPRLQAAAVDVGCAGNHFTMLDPDGRLLAVGEIPAETGTPRLAAMVGGKEV